MVRLSAEQLQQFQDEGFLAVQGVLDPVSDLQPVFDEFASVLDDVATRMFLDGVLTDPHRELPFADRLVEVCAESGRNFPERFDFSLPQSGVTPDTPIHVGPAVFRLLSNPRLLDVVESIVGPEIFSNPVQHIRMKLPKRAVVPGSTSGLVTKTPWHQDNGVVMPEADDGHILTVWLALNRATADNGCLQVIPRTHRQGIEPHCPTPNGLSIPSRFLEQDRAVPVPLEPGGVLLMTQRTMHSSLDNVTERRGPHQHGSALPADRRADRSPGLRRGGLRRPEPGSSRARAARPGGLGGELAGDPGAVVCRREPSLQPLARRRSRLRLNSALLARRRRVSGMFRACELDSRSRSRLRPPCWHGLQHRWRWPTAAGWIARPPTGTAPAWTSPRPTPRTRPAVAPQCASLVPRPAATDADTALTDAGWTLFSSYLGGWDTTIVRGLSGYDGMCRPMGYNAFVFVDGQFAGTISPAAMDSRSDGSGDVRYFASKDSLVAEFQRYGPDDPLCCPSSTTDVTYQISRTPAGPVLVPQQS